MAKRYLERREHFFPVPLREKVRIFAGARQNFAGTIWDFAGAEGQNISNKLDDLIDALKQP